jgi:GTP pyrophosphokinase
MAKFSTNPKFSMSGVITVESWIKGFAAHCHPDDIPLLRQTFSLAQLTGEDKKTPYHLSCFHEGLLIANVLLSLNLDVEAVASGLIYPCHRNADLSDEDLAEHLGPTVARLVKGIARMDAIHSLSGTHHSTNKVRAENLRKMLLAMVEDVRVVLIKLGERLTLLRKAAQFPQEERILLAEEVAHIYAPLANRLGLGQLKCEMEDLAFRYLDEKAYKKLSKHLDEMRLDRENYIHSVIRKLEQAIENAGIQGAKVTGRVKHLFSIYRKMLKKSVDYSQIYDVNAVRVIVTSVEDCYAVLGVVHSLWEPISAEFDDYIAQPKPNGYRSLHTAVKGPDGKNLEAQIRTQQMHDEAELGVAAHWVYKEGAVRQTAYETKVNWLRQVLDWQKEMSGQDKVMTLTATEIFNDRVYVLTPVGDIVDLQQGSTPLDFAYQIHSQIGHRCRGAKVNGHIVPLNYSLKTGDRVEVLTAKQPSPSRDWMNPHLGYLHTARARAKVHHWYKQQDFEKNALDGEALLDKEVRRLGLDVDKLKLAEKLQFKGTKELMAALGCGDIRIAQLLHLIQYRLTTPPAGPRDVLQKGKIAPSVANKSRAEGISIYGVGNLLTHIARCCKPVPGDAIIGFITRGRGVSIHRRDCLNVLEAGMPNQERLIQVEWGQEASLYSVDIQIEAYDRPGLLRDITTVFANEKVNLSASSVSTDKNKNLAVINVTVDLNGINSLSRVLDRLQQVPNVYLARRK